MSISGRVVITGIGTVSANGCSTADIWKLIEKSYEIPDNYSKISTDEFTAKKAYELEEKVHLNDYIDSSDLKRKAQFSKMLCIAGQKALEDASISIDSEEISSERIGTIVTTVHGPMVATFRYLDDVIKGGAKMASPNFFQQTVNNVAGGQLCIQNKLKGVSSTLVGCSSIVYAVNLIRQGLADAILTCGVEELHTHIFAGYDRKHMLAADQGHGEKAVPFSEQANGAILGEGSSALVLESYESAKKRKAHIYAEIIEDAALVDEEFCKDFNEFGSEKSSGLYRAMKKVLEKSGVDKEAIDFVSVAANSSKPVDNGEKNALIKLFGAKEEELGYVASKAIFGETFGASEINAVVCSLLCMKNGRVPGLLYLHDNTHSIEGRELEYALVNSFFIGGAVNSILLGKVKED